MLWGYACVFEQVHIVHKKEEKWEKEEERVNASC